MCILITIPFYCNNTRMSIQYCGGDSQQNIYILCVFILVCSKSSWIIYEHVKSTDLGQLDIRRRPRWILYHLTYLTSWNRGREMQKYAPVILHILLLQLLSNIKLLYIVWSLRTLTIGRCLIVGFAFLFFF
jgi:hypothetical protein